MTFIVLNSSSAGNGYILTSSTGESLIVEAGCSLMKAKEVLNFDLSKVSGLIATHLHNDHTGKLHEYLNAGITCYLSPETAMAKGSHHNLKIVQAKKTYQIGSYKITPFELKHDCENYGYIIWHSEMGLVPFITDTHYCPFKFPGMNNLLLEINYSDKIVNEKLLRGTANMFVRNRVIQSHLELETAKDFLRANDLSKVNNIVLLHLSGGNSDAKLFQREIQELTGKSVFVAESGLQIDFNKTSF